LRSFRYWVAPTTPAINALSAKERQQHSVLEVDVDPIAASGTAMCSGACTPLACTEPNDAGSGCLGWTATTTATADASFSVTFEFPDGGGNVADFASWHDCEGFPVGAYVHVGAAGIDVTK
jgi:hypothetical protein